MNVLNVSVVIPTIVNPTLNETIYHLNKGSIIPSEILLCLPESKRNKKNSIVSHPNIKFIFSKKSNQVLQRIDGFKNAKNKFILQLDDDIIIDIHNIKIILNEIMQNTNIAISPSLLNYDQPKLPSTWMNSPSLFNDKLYDFMMYINNGKKKISTWKNIFNRFKYEF